MHGPISPDKITCRSGNALATIYVRPRRPGEEVSLVVRVPAATQIDTNVKLREYEGAPATIEKWVDKKGVAQHFNISVRSVDNWMKRGLLPYIRTGRSVRFKLSDAEESLNRSIKFHGR